MAAEAAGMRFPLSVLLTAGVLACSPSGATDASKLPPDVSDPATVQTLAGALAFYHRVLTLLPGPLDRFLVETGILTDELAALPVPVGRGTGYTDLDSRQQISFYSGNSELNYYNNFHHLRAQAREARGFLATYASDSAAGYNMPDLRGHLFALEGYAEIFLADLFCSGIPLSTVDFQGDYTLTAGFTTKEVYTHAAELFDSASALASDSIRLRQLAAVGKGRALLGAGLYAEAAAAVAIVPDGYRYQVVDDGTGYASGMGLVGLAPVLATFAQRYAYAESDGGGGTPSASDREGLNGLPYISSGDPRTPIDTLGQDFRGNTMYFPHNYPQSGPVTLTLASGVEARLIEAEGALQAGDIPTWLAKLNALRTDGAYDTQPNANDPNQTDTLWHAGTGGVAGLQPLTDPGTASGRVDLLFRERAFWLYLTGHRQGDLRRLVRQYLRAPDAVYPTGLYPGGSGAYGHQIVAPVPTSERNLNPKYAGCFHLQA